MFWAHFKGGGRVSCREVTNSMLPANTQQFWPGHQQILGGITMTIITWYNTKIVNTNSDRPTLYLNSYEIGNVEFCLASPTKPIWVLCDAKMAPATVTTRNSKYGRYFMYILWHIRSLVAYLRLCLKLSCKVIF